MYVYVIEVLGEKRTAKRPLKIVWHIDVDVIMKTRDGSRKRLFPSG